MLSIFVHKEDLWQAAKSRDTDAGLPHLQAWWSNTNDTPRAQMDAAGIILERLTVAFLEVVGVAEVTRVTPAVAEDDIAKMTGRIQEDSILLL